MYSCGPPHMANQKQDDRLEHTYSSYVMIWDVTLKTCQRRWMIGRRGERGSGISVLAARHDDDDDDRVPCDTRWLRSLPRPCKHTGRWFWLSRQNWREFNFGGELFYMFFWSHPQGPIRNYFILAREEIPTGSFHELKLEYIYISQLY